MKLLLSTLLLLVLSYANGSDLTDQAPAAPGSRGSQAQWRQWEEWSGCSVTCDEGIRVRVRECSRTDQCPGTRLEIGTCQANAACPRWTDWSQWTPCSSTCGFGAKERSRTCDQQNCAGPNRDFAQCEYGCPCPWAGWRPNQKLTFNQWGSWQQWAQCSSSCGPGKRMRCRKCAEGSICTGPISQTEPCNGGYCPVQPRAEWERWGEWGQCSVSCGRGLAERKRSCRNGAVSDCPGIAAEARDCVLAPCQREPPMPDFQWTSWNLWGRCSRTCGGGTRERQRQCRGGAPYNCPGSERDRQACNNQPCGPRPTQAPWTPAPTTPSGVCPWQWTGWTGCLGGCGGLRTRQTTCGSCGGFCPGRTNQFRQCGCAKQNTQKGANPTYQQPQPQPRYAYVRYAYGLPGYQSGTQNVPYYGGYQGAGTAYGSYGNYQYLSNYIRRRRRH